jgi:hypothetical protein
MNWDPVAYLKTRHTKQLMAIRDSIYAVNGGAHREYFERREVIYADWIKDKDVDPDTVMLYNVGEKNEPREVSMAQVKAELATREHVPNKQEAKAARQARAKAQRNR